MLPEKRNPLQPPVLGVQGVSVAALDNGIPIIFNISSVVRQSTRERSVTLPNADSPLWYAGDGDIAASNMRWME